ncbi:MAG: hypothetical protein ACQEQM_05155, partial [Thermoplasmatota archaeon]
MLDEKKLLTIAVIISLIGTASLYLYSANQDAERVEITEIDENMLGSQVETSGFISNIVTLEDRHMMELKEDEGNTTITAFVDNRVLSYIDEKDEVRAGAEVFVSGRIDIYEGEMNMIVSRAGDFRIIENALSSFTVPSELLDNPEWHGGMEHKIRGEVFSINSAGEDTIIELKPLNGDDCILMVKIKGWDFTETYSISRGNVIVVKGSF